VRCPALSISALSALVRLRIVKERVEQTMPLDMTGIDFIQSNLYMSHAICITS
jgi:hypothetical protein